MFTLIPIFLSDSTLIWATELTEFCDQRSKNSFLKRFAAQTSLKFKRLFTNNII